MKNTCERCGKEKCIAEACIMAAFHSGKAHVDSLCHGHPDTPTPEKGCRCPYTPHEAHAEHKCCPTPKTTGWESDFRKLYRKYDMPKFPNGKMDYSSKYIEFIRRSILEARQKMWEECRGRVSGTYDSGSKECRPGKCVGMRWCDFHEGKSKGWQIALSALDELKPKDDV